MARDLTLPPLVMPDVHAGQVVISYDAEGDILSLDFVSPRLATSRDVDDLWLRVDPLTHEVLGIEVEDFEGFYLRHHPELSEAWARDERGVVISHLIERMRALDAATPVPRQ